eukprot:TRINITY_DN79959_c0_g1_i1.p1 TRINITY_DN79959_c0_g1~~TRINITY_DN79959_c0_g1_i1.p1  ORF type:complete len:441 (+),score=87.81 TRINITY_DN79959_c0_g1_i1:76-1398(+)
MASFGRNLVRNAPRGSKDLQAAAKEKADEEEKSITARLVRQAEDRERQKQAKTSEGRQKVDNFSFGLSLPEAVEVVRTRIFEKDRSADASKVLVGILGSTNIAKETEDLVRSLAFACSRLGEHALFLTSGSEGTQHLFTEFCSPSLCWNLLANGERHTFRHGRFVTSGANLAERDEVFQSLAKVIILVEGGERSSVMAMEAQEQGAAILPLRRTGGASAGMYGCHCRKPGFANVLLWDKLSDETSGPEAYIDNVVQLIIAAAHFYKEKDAGNSLYAGFLRRQAKAAVQVGRQDNAGPPNGLENWTATFYRTRAKHEKSEFVTGDMSGYRRWPTRSAEEKLKEDAVKLNSPRGGDSSTSPGSPRSPGVEAQEIQNLSVMELEEHIMKIDQRKVLLLMELESRGASAAKEIFNNMDTNHDGVLDVSEFNRPYVKSAFDQVEF